MQTFTEEPVESSFVSLCLNLRTEFIPSEAVISNEVRETAEIFLDFCVAFPIALFGVVANVIVIIVFSRQGFKDSINVSMTIIAFWDLIKSVSGSAQRMSGPMRLISPREAESWTNVSIIVFNYLISFCSYVSSVLAAYVALERCLCVTIPFKVKAVITPKLTFTICMTISIVIFSSFLVVYASYDFVWVFTQKYNATVAVYVYNDFFCRFKEPVFDFYNLAGTIWPILSFIVIVVCTIIITHKLGNALKFRKSFHVEVNQISNKEKQAVKMLLVIIAVYIVNLTPRIVLYLTKYFIFEFYVLRLYHNLFMINLYILFIFDLANSAVNIFIFYSMSSGFRNSFKEIFHSCCLIRLP